MTIIKQEKHEILVEVKTGEEIPMPTREPFSDFPFLRIMSATIKGVVHKTDFFPTTTSQPSTMHPKTIRLINFNWNGLNALVEYSSTSGLIKVISGNVDYVTIKIR